MNKKELKVRNKCRDICNSNDKGHSLTLIKKEFPGSAITVSFSYQDIQNGHKHKMYMGMIMWEDVNISF